MSIAEAFSYYGSLVGVKPIRSLAEDILRDQENSMMEKMREMEDRIKRHVTECKREIIKELQSMMKPDQIKLKPTKGETKDGCKSRAF